MALLEARNRRPDVAPAPKFTHILLCYRILYITPIFNRIVNYRVHFLIKSGIL